jgi:hypothetical protein
MDDHNQIPPDAANADVTTDDTTPTSGQNTPDELAAQASDAADEADEADEAVMSGAEPSSATEPIVDAWTPVPEASVTANVTSDDTSGDVSEDVSASAPDASGDDAPEPVAESAAAPDDTAGSAPMSDDTSSSATSADSDEGATTTAATDYPGLQSTCRIRLGGSGNRG